MQCVSYIEQKVAKCTDTGFCRQEKWDYLGKKLAFSILKELYFSTPLVFKVKNLTTASCSYSADLHFFHHECETVMSGFITQLCTGS